MGTRSLLLCLMALLLLQAAFTNAYLPVSEWFSSEGAIYSDDYSYHYSVALNKVQHLQEFGKTWVYDPDMRAGNIAIGVTSIDDTGWALFTYLLHALLGMSVEVAFKLFFVLGTLSIPFICYAAARNFGSTRGRSLVAAFLGTVLMHNSIMVNFYQWGTVSFVFVSYLALLTLASFYRFCQNAKLVDLLRASFFLLCSVLIHGFAFPILFVPLLVCYVIYFRRLRPAHHAAILISLALVCLALLPAYYPLFQLLDTVVKSAMVYDFYTNKSILGPLKIYLFRNNPFNSYGNMIFRKDEWIDIVLLLLALPGLYRWYTGRQKALAVIVAAAAGFLLWLSWYGAFYEITNLTNLRFLISLNIVFIFPAAEGLFCLYEVFLADKPRRIQAAAAAACCFLLLALTAPAYFQIFYMRAFQLVCRVPEPCKDLVAWINKNTGREGRIMLESSDFDSGHQWYGGHIEYLFPIWTNREYLDNSYRFNPLADTFTSFGSGELFWRPVGSFTADSLKAYFDLYNVKWIICWSEASRKAFGAFSPFIVPLAKIDKFQICRVERSPTYFLKGSGSSRSEANKIHLTGIKADGGEIIVSYHWMKFLRTDPPREVEKAFLLDDPVGFIKIKDPPPELVIYNNYH